MPELSNEQIGQIALDIAEAVMGNEIVEVTFAPGDEQDRFRSDIQIEATRVLRMALQQRRASVVTDEMVERACRATVLGEDADGKPVHLEPAEARAALTAALSAVSHETGDGETEATLPDPDQISAANAAAYEEEVRALRQRLGLAPAPTDETQGVKREAVGYVSDATLAYLELKVSDVRCHIYGTPVSIHNAPLFSLSQLEEVERDRDEAQNLAREYQRQRNGNFARADTAEASLAAMTAERDDAREALKPFAALYAESMRDFPDGSAKCDRPDDKQAWGFNNANISWGDFRRAALSAGTPS